MGLTSSGAPNGSFQITPSGVQPLGSSALSANEAEKNGSDFLLELKIAARP
jgi:hypothetical protein